ncbi:MAG: hypothetical protein CFE24_08215 [Flavobacterium sp. BFFFF2]|nr:MAG: hypothetical protein CFE24_08215 [Flavobacterium sp. BFFFF2]
MYKSLFFAFLFAVFCSPLQAQLPASFPTAGLHGFYEFNQSMSDCGPLQNNGNNTNVSYTTDRFDTANNALNLDGISGHFATIPSPTTVDFSCSFWINAAVFSQSNNINQVLFDSPLLGLKVYYSHVSESTTYSNKLTVAKLFNTPTGTQTLEWLLPSNQNNAAWLHLAFTFDGLQFKTFSNGVLATSNSITTGFTTASLTADPLFYIGKNEQQMQGVAFKLDALGLWNSALDAAEVYRVYRFCSVPAPSGQGVQPLCVGATLQDVTTTATAVKWYASPLSNTPLLINSFLTNNTTYYASQTINQCESPERLAVLTQLAQSPGGTITTNQSAVCVGDVPPNILMSGFYGTVPYTFYYSINDGPVQTAISDIITGQVVLQPSVATSGTFQYKLLQVLDANGFSCSGFIPSQVAIQVTQLFITSLPADQTICPGNQVSLSFSGTPNSFVRLISSTNNTYIVPLNSSGQGVLSITLNETTQFNLVNMAVSANCLLPFNNQLVCTINVVPNGCATVKINDTNGQVFESCQPGACQTLSLEYSPIPSTTSYAISSIPYCPQASYNDPSYTVVHNSSDDAWSSIVDLPFSFCFYNSNYNKVQIGSNGAIMFNSSNVPLTFCPYSLETQSNIPNTNFPIRNAIFGVFQDSETRTSGGQAPADVSINWKLVGTYPCRKLIVNFYNFGLFQCNQSVGAQTSQVVFYEVSNIIEVFVKRRTRCINWNGGRGVIGIINSTGTDGLAAPGRNVTDAWTATNEAWRFTPNGPSIPATVSWTNTLTNEVVSTENTATICPTQTTTYKAKVVYDVCGVLQSAERTFEFKVNEQVITVHNLSQCGAAFNLFDGLDMSQSQGNEDTIDFYTTFDGANQATYNQLIADPLHFFANSTRTIYVRIEISNCFYVLHFEVQPTGVSCAPVSQSNATFQSVSFQWNAVPNAQSYQIYYKLGNSTTTTPIDIGTQLTYTISCSPGTSIVFYVTPIGPSCTATTSTTGLSLSCPTPQFAAQYTGTVCTGSSATIQIASFPNASFFYTIGTQNASATVDASGLLQIQTPTITQDTMVQITGVNFTNVPACFVPLQWQNTIHVVTQPQLTVVSEVNICAGNAAHLQWIGSPNTIIQYADNFGTSYTATTDGQGNVSLATPALYQDTVFTINQLAYAGTDCAIPYNNSVHVHVLNNIIPTLQVTSSTVCVGDPNPVITLQSGNNQPATFTYQLDNQSPQTATATNLQIPISTSLAGIHHFSMLSYSMATGACIDPTLTLAQNVEVIETAAPVAVTPQNFVNQGALTDLQVTGSNIVWYADLNGGSPLNNNTPLIDGTTYYASQTLQQCESHLRTPVLVQIDLGVDIFEKYGIKVYPNPTSGLLQIRSPKAVDQLALYSMTGQLIMSQKGAVDTSTLDLSSLPAASYMLMIITASDRVPFVILKK